jgi:hypothetical protein
VSESAPSLLVLLAARAAADPGRFEAEVEAEGERLAKEAGPSAVVTVAFSLLRDTSQASQPGLDVAALNGLAASGLPPSLGVPITTFDAALEVRGTEVSGHELIDGLAHRLPSTDAGSSLACIGVEHVITSGEAPIRVFYCLNRTAVHTHDSFSHEWLTGLTEHTRHTPGMSGYRQLHIDASLSALACRAAGLPAHHLDGVALEWYEELGSLLSAIGWVSEPDSKAAAAEHDLIDFSSARAMLAVNRG